MTTNKTQLIGKLSKELNMARGSDDTNSMLIGFVLLVLVGFMVIQPYFEAKSFNRLTGGNATYADALFSELRVDGSSQIIKKQ
jgi:hypothetical protein